MTPLNRRTLFQSAAAAVSIASLPVAGQAFAAPSAGDAGGEATGWRGGGKSPRLASEAVITRFGFGSCLRQDRPAPILDLIAKQAPQLFIMMGDNVYGDVITSDAEDPEFNALIAAYAGLAARADWRRLRRAVPLLATWDDHDFGQNDGGASFPWADRARSIFLDFWNLRGTSQDGHKGIYGAYRFGPKGRRVQFILLDTRTFRCDLVRLEPAQGQTVRPYAPDTDPAKTMLGAAQWAWLEAELQKPADVRFIVSSIQVLPLSHPFEKWANLPSERKKLFDLITRTKANGVIFLSGDRHRAIMSRDGEAAPYIFTEATSSALNQTGPARWDETDRTSLGAYVTEDNIGEVEIDWDKGEVTLAIRTRKNEIARTERLALGDLRAS